jgi:zinc protease
MSKHLSRRVAVLLAGSFLVSPVPAAAQPAKTNGWGLALTDVTPDPSIRYGVLPNGMKYAIMRNAVPKGAGVVRLQFEFGSIAESEEERGLAHFIEHMAFNGSTNVPEGEMVKILERQGLKFGPDTNAATGFDKTVYMLDLPKADNEHLDTALMRVRGGGGEVKFDPAAVDRERGVILGERRFRDTYQLHQVIDQIGFQIPATPYPERLPIGTETVLKTAPAARIKDLYQRYYRPENATFVFVGDADPVLIEQKIRAKFSDWKGAGPAGTGLPRGTVDLKRGGQFDTFVDPAVATQVNLTSFRPWEEPVDTMAERRTDMVRGLALAAFNRRMQKLVSAPDSILLAGQVAENDADDAALGTSLVLVAKDGAWKEALSIGEQELRRALQHGFNQPELDLIKAEGLGMLQTSAAQAEARSHQSLANSILGVVGKPDFVTTPAFRLAVFERIAPAVTLAEVDAAFRKLWSGSTPLVHVSDKKEVPVADIAAAFSASTKVAVAAPKADAAVAFAYNDFGKDGQIVEDRRVDDLGIRTIRFANNVRLNIKQTDYEKGKIAFSVRLAGGTIALPKDRPGYATMLSALSTLAATGKHSMDDIRTITAGHTIQPGWVVSSDAFVAAGTTTVRDLDLQMKLSAAYLTDPGYRAEAASQWGNIVPILDKQLEATPSSLMGARLPAILASNDWRFGVPPTSELAKRNLAEARTLLAPMTASAPIEIGIVGDIDEAAAIKAVAQSFGALPARATSQQLASDARSAHFRSDTAPILLKHSGGQDQALVAAAWPTDDDKDFRKEIGLSLLGEVMDLLLTDSVREELGASYGVSVGSTMSSTFDHFGYLMVNSIVAPDKADEIDGVFAKVAGQLRDTPVSDDMLARAREPMLEAAAKQMRQNGYWLGYVDEAQSKADRLERIRTRDKLIRSITAADLQALARQYLVDAKLQRVRILSDKVQVAAAATAPAKAN